MYHYADHPMIALLHVNKFIVSGGTFDCGINFHFSSCDLVLFGGTYHDSYILQEDSQIISVTVAPWVDVTYDENGIPTSSTTNQFFAVSTSNIVSGAYNDVYGYQWNLTAGALANLTLPTDKTYYLYGRDADGRYESLNLRCNDGKTWEKVA